VGAEFNVSRDALQRHMARHVTPARRAELIAGPVQIAKLAQRAVEEDRSLLDYLSILRSELLRLFLSAKQRGLTYDAASIAQRLLNTLEAIGRLTGQLRAAGISITNVVGSNNQTLVLNSPEVAKLQGTIIRALADEPSARAKVIAALRDMEAPPTVAASGPALPPPAAIDMEAEVAQ
jgi:hypothetical protein